MPVKTYGAEDARAPMRTVLDDILAGKAEAIIERHGKPAAVVISYERWQKMEQEKEKQRKQFAEARSELDAGGGIAWDDLKAQLIAEGLA